MTETPTVLAPDRGRLAGPALWPTLLLRGILATAFGVALLVWPHVSVRLLGVLVGIWLLLAGAGAILGVFATWRGLGWQVLSGAVGVLFLAGGVACLRDVTKGVNVLAFLIALAWLFIGLAELVAASAAARPARIWLVVLGLLALAIGFLFMLWPAPSLTVVVLLAGFGSLVAGIAEIVLALRLRRLLTPPAATA